MPDSGSAWATNQAYMAHFTVTDVAAGRFHAHERFARGAVDLAGATTEPGRPASSSARRSAPRPRSSGDGQSVPLGAGSSTGQRRNGLPSSGCAAPRAR
ncbi:MAG: lipocalin-like domain-containing protein [Chloroflexota bacterium]